MSINGLFLLVEFNFQLISLKILSINLQTKISYIKSAPHLVVQALTDSDQATFDLCDLSGKIYKSGVINRDIPIEINVSGFHNGQYFLVLIDEGKIKKQIITIEI